MNTHSCSPRPLTRIAQAMLQLRQAARDTQDTQLKFDADRIATELDHLIKRNSRPDRGEE
jgi:retron-type reverse transcriptase